MNQTTGKMFGYQRTEILGTDFLELVSPEFRETVLEYLRTKNERPYEVAVM